VGVCKCGSCNIWLCVNVGFVMCGCFGILVFTCIYCDLVLFLLCIFILFMLLFNSVIYEFLLLCLCVLIVVYVLLCISFFIVPTGTLRLPD
jgi:hypothetical protein